MDFPHYCLQEGIPKPRPGANEKLARIAGIPEHRNVGGNRPGR